MALEITPEEYNSTRLPLDNTVEIDKQRLLNQTSKEIIGITSEELWTAIKQNSKIKNESSTQYNSVPPVNKGRSSINIDFYAFEKYVEENLSDCIQVVNNIKAKESHKESYRLSILNSRVLLAALQEICEDDVDILNKYLGHETRLSMTNFIFQKRCEMGDFYQNTECLSPVMHPVKFGKENLWTYIPSSLIIWKYLESKDILDEKCIKERGQDRQGPYHE